MAKPTLELKKTPGRISAFDLMRGYLITVIVSVHLAYYPSLLGSFDGRGQLWVSEAEGFFFISGLLIGLIRRKDLERSGFMVASRNVLARGLRLYTAGIVLTIFYSLWAHLVMGVAGDRVKNGLDTTDSFFAIVGKVVLLQYSYGWSDFLIFYAGFLFIAPLVLWLLSKRLWWVVLAGSLGVWVWRWTGGYGVYNSFLQWQVYFFTGSLIGYYWHNLVQWIRRLSVRAQTGLQIMAVSGMVLCTAGGLLAVFGPQHSSNVLFHWIEVVNSSALYNTLLTDGRIGLLRPLILIITFAGAFTLVHRFEEPITKYAGWFLLPMGQNSLYVYILGGVALFTIPFFTRSGGFWLNSALELSSIGLIWLAVRYKLLFKIIPR